MKKIMLSLMILAMILWCAVAVNAGSDIEKKLKESFPDVTFDSVKESPVKGIYEVTEGRRILYFAPKERIIISGQMFDKTKKNITADRIQEISIRFDEKLALKAKDLLLEKAVKTGNGKHIVIEFTDPDCPFCRNAARFFETRTDVTKYTFFIPMPMHPDAPNKVRYILCQNDRAKALEEVMQGKIDSQKYEICTNAEVNNLINLHKSEGAKMEVSATPFFIIDGTVVNGADIPKIEKILNKKAAGEK
jgi:thiol:disulfide interchange protein DsbC